MDLELQVSTGAGESMDFGVFVNNVRVGGLTLDPSFVNSLQSFNFSFASVSGPDYFIEVVGESTISPGPGAYSIAIDGRSAATLTPAPGVWALLRMGGLPVSRRRR